MRSVLLSTMIGLFLLSPGAWALAIMQVHHEPAMFDPENGESAEVIFRVTSEAMVTLNIFDGRDLLVRRITADKPLPAGDHALTWDGKDERARSVPPEAYRYTLVAKSVGGKTVEYDVSDLTGGEDLSPREIKWDPEAKSIRYLVTKPARVNIRMGLANNGPLLCTLIDWVPRQAGIQEEAWDGKDAAGVLDLSQHPKLEIGVQAFALSDNTILIGPRNDTVNLIQDISWQATRRQPKKRTKKRMYAHSQQPIETRRDFKISLELPASLPRNGGLPVVTGRTPVRLDIDPADRERLLAERFEPVFFVDGQFAFEAEVGFLPMTWIWDPQGSNEGVHYLTANVRGYEGHFGATTLKIYVKPGPGS